MNRKVYLIIGIILIVGAFDFPYNYYIFLRFGVFFGCSFNLFSLYFHIRKRLSDHFLAVLFMVSALVVFNPIIPIHLEKSVWIKIDLIYGIIFIILALIFNKVTVFMRFEDFFYFVRYSLGAIFREKKASFELVNIAMCYQNDISAEPKSDKSGSWIGKIAFRDGGEDLYLSGLEALTYKESGPGYHSRIEEWKVHSKGQKYLVAAGLIGNVHAQLRIAAHYENDKNAYKNMFEAATWYTLASDSNDPKAKEWLLKNPQYAKQARLFSNFHIELIRANIYSGNPMAVFPFADAIFNNQNSLEIYADALQVLFRFKHWTQIDPSMFDQSIFRDINQQINELNGPRRGLAYYVLGGCIECSIMRLSMDDAIKYYLEATKYNCAEAYYRLSEYYFQNNESDLSKKFLRLAKENGYLYDDACTKKI